MFTSGFVLAVAAWKPTYANGRHPLLSFAEAISTPRSTRSDLSFDFRLFPWRRRDESAKAEEQALIGRRLLRELFVEPVAGS
jgi:hypothetical protein